MNSLTAEASRSAATHGLEAAVRVLNAATAAYVAAFSEVPRVYGRIGHMEFDAISMVQSDFRDTISHVEAIHGR